MMTDRPSVRYLDKISDPRWNTQMLVLLIATPILLPLAIMATVLRWVGAFVATFSDWLTSITNWLTPKY